MLIDGAIGKLFCSSNPSIIVNTTRDTYHDPGRHYSEEMNGARNLFYKSRGFKRYDPQARRYREWSTPHDWNGFGTGGYGVGPNGFGYPRFTSNEGEKILLRLARGKLVKPYRMGKEWHHDGPKVSGLRGK
jgi:hypothetical protein